LNRITADGRYYRNTLALNDISTANATSGSINMHDNDILNIKQLTCGVTGPLYITNQSTTGSTNGWLTYDASASSGSVRS